MNRRHDGHDLRFMLDKPTTSQSLMQRPEQATFTILYNAKGRTIVGSTARGGLLIKETHDTITATAQEQGMLIHLQLCASSPMVKPCHAMRGMDKGILLGRATLTFSR